MNIQGIIRDYFEKLNSNKFENREDMNSFLDIYSYPKLNEEDINHLKICITQNELKQQ
jgi:hypothetical protein